MTLSFVFLKGRGRVGEIQRVEEKFSNSEAEGTQSRPLSVREAGARGGTVTRERYGRAFYQRIGATGGRRTAELYGALLSHFGKRGGRPRRPALDEPVREKDQQ